MGRTQQQRRAETRSRLLRAAAAVVAEHGISGASVDAIADAAERTSGSVYAHFGSKDGLVTALLDSWKDEVAAVIAAELVAAPTVTERLAAIWRNLVDPPHGDADWLRLEHELLAHAERNPETRDRLAARYRELWDLTGAAAATWCEEAGTTPPATGRALGAVVIGLLFGMELQHRLDPETVTDEVVVGALRAALGLTDRDQADAGSHATTGRNA